MADSIQQGFLRDEDGNLVVTGGDGVTGKMDYGFIRDEDTRALVVVGPDGESIGGSTAPLVASGIVDTATEEIELTEESGELRLGSDPGTFRFVPVVELIATPEMAVTSLGESPDVFVFVERWAATYFDVSLRDASTGEPVDAKVLFTLRNGTS